MNIQINPYRHSVTCDGVTVIEKFIPFPNWLDHLCVVDCEYENGEVTFIGSTHRFINHYVNKKYYVEHIDDYIKWYKQEKTKQEEFNNEVDSAIASIKEEGNRQSEALQTIADTVILDAKIGVHTATTTTPQILAKGLQFTLPLYGTLPLRYTVGTGTLLVFKNGSLTVKDVFYKELGNTGETSIKIEFLQNVPKDTILTFVLFTGDLGTKVDGTSIIWDNTYGLKVSPEGVREQIVNVLKTFNIVADEADIQIEEHRSANTSFTLPANKTYKVGTGQLQLYLDGKLLVLGRDYEEIGTPNSTSDIVMMLIQIPIYSVIQVKTFKLKYLLE